MATALFDVGRVRARIDQLSAQAPVDWLFSVFAITCSCYCAGCLKRKTPNFERLRLRSRINELLTNSLSAAGSYRIVSMMQEDVEQIGQFKGRCLIQELTLMSKEPGLHAYKQSTVERPDTPRILDQESDLPTLNQCLV